MLSYRIGDAELTVYHEHKIVTTRFPGGYETTATPNYRDEDYARAAALGYGRDVWHMTVDHEICHNIVGLALGYPYSPTLYHAAVKNMLPEQGWFPAWRYEEELVFALQGCVIADTWCIQLGELGTYNASLRELMVEYTAAKEALWYG